jgi:hypothetical protein
MGPPIRIVTRCISAWLISSLAPETLSGARENQVSWEGDDFGRFWISEGPRVGDRLIRPRFFRLKQLDCGGIPADAFLRRIQP